MSVSAFDSLSLFSCCLSVQRLPASGTGCVMFASYCNLIVSHYALLIASALDQPILTVLLSSFSVPLLFAGV